MYRDVKQHMINQCYTEIVLCYQTHMHARAHTYSSRPDKNHPYICSVLLTSNDHAQSQICIACFVSRHGFSGPLSVTLQAVVNTVHLDNAEIRAGLFLVQIIN